MCSNAVRMTDFAKIERAAVLGCALLMPDSSQNDRAASPLCLNKKAVPTTRHRFLFHGSEKCWIRAAKMWPRHQDPR